MSMCQINNIRNNFHELVLIKKNTCIYDKPDIE